jgi:hypothetical protein
MGNQIRFHFPYSIVLLYYGKTKLVSFPVFGRPALLWENKPDFISRTRLPGSIMGKQTRFHFPYSTARLYYGKTNPISFPVLDCPALLWENKPDFISRTRLPGSIMGKQTRFHFPYSTVLSYYRKTNLVSFPVFDRPTLLREINPDLNSLLVRPALKQESKPNLSSNI